MLTNWLPHRSPASARFSTLQAGRPAQYAKTDPKSSCRAFTANGNNQSDQPCYRCGNAGHRQPVVITVRLSNAGLQDGIP
ncbi:hypothetical protein BN439_3284 [Erwinia amylovora Ea644]|nr:hypothetical protein BN439_3284 [Erwinia amylovora Ea644]CCP08390.1 hypothetical protein BN440_3390 [Erwinia amylovora MR1]